MCNERCGLCENARPLYSPADKRLVKLLGRHLALTCVDSVQDAMPLVFDDTNARAEFGWACFVPMVKDWK